MLPTHGAVHSVFLLAHALRYGRAQGLDAWIASARDRSAYLAQAIDHRPVARWLLHQGLAIDTAKIDSTAELDAIAARADRATYLAIASMILERNPPVWLAVAVSANGIRWELIPTRDMQALSWLRPELDQLLTRANHSFAKENQAVAAGLGLAAELVVFATFEGMHYQPLHVARVSDRFGYDIETSDGLFRRWEVKGCVSTTRGSFHLTRNEFNQSRRHADWRLVQVEFNPAVLTSAGISAADVAKIRELPSEELAAVAPPESGAFYWEQSARLTPSGTAWLPSTLVVPPHFSTMGIEALAERALAHSRFANQ